MIKQVKFKRLKVNAGFTLSVSDGTMAVKLSEKEYSILGASDVSAEGRICPIKADPKQIVWADSVQIKRWYKW